MRVKDFEAMGDGGGKQMVLAVLMVFSDEHPKECADLKAILEELPAQMFDKAKTVLFRNGLLMWDNAKKKLVLTMAGKELLARGVQDVGRKA